MSVEAPTKERRALLARLLEERRARQTFVPSYPQKRLWFLDQLQPRNPVYNVPLGYRLEGRLDVAALSASLREIVRRHEVLRTVFREIDGELRQVVTSDLVVAMPLVDLGGLDAAERRRVFHREARRPFDLGRGPLLHAVLLRRQEDSHLLLLCFHHIVFDGWSAGVLVRELGALYEAFRARRPSPLPELGLQYGDFAHWQQRQLQGEKLELLLEYWRSRLGDAPSFSGLLGDRSRPAVVNYRGGYRSFKVPEPLVAALSEVGQEREGTLFMTLLAAFAVLLHRHHQGDELIVGTPMANRNRPELEPLIGFFTNTLVLRLDLGGDPTFPELLARVRQVALEAHEHQDMPFERLVEELHPDRNLAQNPLFQVLFSYREGEEEDLRLPGIVSRLEPGDTETAKFDLTLSLSRVGGALAGRFEFAADLFEASTIERLVGRLEILLAGLAEKPRRRLSALPVLSAAEKRLLVETWNDTTVDFPAAARIEDGVARQALEHPARPALIFGDDRLSYGALWSRAEALAVRLQSLGVGPETVVGLYLERSLDLVIGMLGILRAGGAYLPLDPAYPEDRVRSTLSDSTASVVVTCSRLAGRLPAAELRVLSLDREAAAAPAATLAAAGHAANSAYLMYTSGSTGRPKGVSVSHRNVLNFMTAMDGVLAPGAAAESSPGTWLAVTSVAFDISVLEILWTLNRGFEVVVQREESAAHRLARQTAGGSAPPVKPLDFSLFYFGGEKGSSAGERYRPMLEGARFADRNGFAAVWTPERHFHDFGGLYPNPSVTGAAMAAVTERLEIRAGSVVVPLQDPLRVAEEWSVVDHLSGGRVGISFASGWHANDFALAPDNYARRKEIMLERIEEVRRLWRGETVERRSGTGKKVELGIFPRPRQKELPVWLTSAGNPETFAIAGRIGARVLTHLLGHDIDQLAEKLALYRENWRRHQDEGEGHVTLMLHTFLGPDHDAARGTARGPLAEYLRTSFGLLASLGRSMGREVDFENLPAEELEELVSLAVERFADTAALLGTPESCAGIVERLQEIGVDEVACLIDFGVDAELVLEHLPHIAALRDQVAEKQRQAAAERIEVAAESDSGEGEASVADQIRRHAVTHLQCTPSMARLLLADREDGEALGGLEKLLLGGEALPPEVAGSVFARGAKELLNMYGPTETTVWSTVHTLDSAIWGAPEGRPTSVSIGRPIANTRVYVVDRFFRLAPLGVPGELVIGGAGTTRGYHRRPATTAERFVPDPFGAEPGSRLYRTGDLTRHRTAGARGELEFLGRLDHQVKLRGHRIELGEIEARLAEHRGVGRAAVVVRQGEAGDANLVAFCVADPDAGAELGGALLRQHLEALVPDYMVPASYVFLEEFPQTPNGKVDRKKLTARALEAGPSERSAAVAEFKPPKSELEQTLAEIWRRVLNLERVGVDDNFFDLGGNSFSIVHLRSRLLESLGRAPTLVELYRHPTVAALARALEEGGPTAEKRREKVLSQVEKRRQALKRRGRGRPRPRRG